MRTMTRPTLAVAMLFTACVSEARAIAMAPMEHVGPQPRLVDLRPYATVMHVGPDSEHHTITAALQAAASASAGKRVAILVAAGTYPEARVQLKPYVDLFGGFAADWKSRDVYQHASVIDGRGQGPVVLGADDAILDGFTIRGGVRDGFGAGILCDGVSPALVNNTITANMGLKPRSLVAGLGKQIASEGAGIALLHGSSAYVANNLLFDNSTEAGSGAALTMRGNVRARVLRNVFCNNTAGTQDNGEFHGKVGSRSSPGAAIACSESSSPLISFNVIALGTALFKNDAGGVWVEGNSTPLIRYNWIAGNTAYDDGGAIYVMGSLYYDAQGERHDSSPDEPVRIEDNLIAGNSAVTGGPGGVRASRFGRIELRRNVIVANMNDAAFGAEGGQICISDGNTIADNNKTSPSFRFASKITGRSFDSTRCVTSLTLARALETGEFAGAVVRIGGQWSVIQSARESTLCVWGRLTDDATTVEILDDYTSSAPRTGR